MKRFWSDEVEALIAEKMSSGKSVYAASKELTNECSQRGWRCPVKISLYSRLQAKRERIKRYGINIKSIAALEPLGA